jgi:hypothetical protein
MSCESASLAAGREMALSALGVSAQPKASMAIPPIKSVLKFIVFI